MNKKTNDKSKSDKPNKNEASKRTKAVIGMDVPKNDGWVEWKQWLDDVSWMGGRMWVGIDKRKQIDELHDIWRMKKSCLKTRITQTTSQARIHYA